MSPKAANLTLVLLAVPLLSSCVYTAVQIDCLTERRSFQKPVIEEGEFNYALEYIADGERFSRQDTLTCKYENLKCTYAGLNIEWSRETASGNDGFVLAHLGPGEWIEVSLSTCDVLMDTLPDFYDIDVSPTDWAWLHKEDDYMISRNRVEAEELWTRYKIRILSLEESPRIVQPASP